MWHRADAPPPKLTRLRLDHPTRSCGNVCHCTEHPAVDCARTSRQGHVRYAHMRVCVCVWLHGCIAYPNLRLPFCTSPVFVRYMYRSHARAHVHNVPFAGLVQECYEEPFSTSGSVVCETYADPPGEWTATFVFLLVGMSTSASGPLLWSFGRLVVCESTLPSTHSYCVDADACR